MKQCIECSAELTHIVHEGIALDSCPNGHGLWVDRSELAQVAASEHSARAADEQQREVDAARGGLRSVMDAVAGEGLRPCPECGREMVKHQYADYSSVVIDSCAQHGVWLDSGELERVEAYAEGYRRGMKPSAPSGLPVAGLLSGLGRATAAPLPWQR